MLTLPTGACPIGAFQHVKLTSYVQRLRSTFVSPKVLNVFSYCNANGLRRIFFYFILFYFILFYFILFYSYCCQIKALPAAIEPCKEQITALSFGGHFFTCMWRGNQALFCFVYFFFNLGHSIRDNTSSLCSSLRPRVHILKITHIKYN